MSSPDLIRQQRALLRQFRTTNHNRVQAEVAAKNLLKTEQSTANIQFDQAQKAAVTQQSKAKADAEDHYKDECTASDVIIDQGRKTGEGQVAIVSNAQQEGQALLSQANLQRLIGEVSTNIPTFRPDSNPGQELIRTVAMSRDTVRNIRTLVNDLAHCRKVNTRRQNLLAIVGAVVLIFFLIVVFVQYQSWQDEQRVRYAQATATQVIVQTVAAATAAVAAATDQAIATTTAVAQAQATATQIALHAKATATAISTQAKSIAVSRAPDLKPLIERFGIQFVEVPAGAFMMGSIQGEGEKDEFPQHSVLLDSYWIGLTEVTNAQYAPFVESNGYNQSDVWTENGWSWRQSNNVIQPRFWNDTQLNTVAQPVVGVSWYEAIAYARWLSRETGLSVRLPSEAEWEKASCGTDERAYPWGNQEPTSELANFNNLESRLKDVGSYMGGASPYDVLDMSGNVWEWTNSLYRDYPYNANDGREEWTANDKRVLHGGSFHNGSYSIRCAERFSFAPTNRNEIIGFRVVISIR